MGTLAEFASFLPHCAFQSVKDLCPQYLANALSVDWLNPHPIEPNQNRFNVDTLTPKRGSNASSSPRAPRSRGLTSRQNPPLH